ncbi:MAG TPA: bifunctional diaminohydroxyphosphoribosylaminopyrimidine deaminase/5-amino-6-(5-phosphoribosylamino)uracil reductase RibD, partial [Deltaproteobacteria bacterium]|nr:bifunctional diaminohydroxyphosphoribosylaminopyrimidine deaminase/5-amino-6-(5-phosphoribosylamino)uracil reductase RibD [Deltaproteobacteria bacterium]
MLQALEQARKGLGRTAPNPPVGAVIVKAGRIIGEGFHPAAGQPHAEIFALKSCKEDPKGATLYVTLEPCRHFGKTPPCTRAIIAAGLRRVVIATRDPNPIMAGKGRQELVDAGIEVVSGVCEDEARDLIRWYTHWMMHKRPFVMVKAAVTLDGRIAAAGGDSKWISSEASRKKVHVWRNEFDAVLVGIGTVIKDDPLLTCRIEGGRDPLRVIIDP